MTQVTIPTDLLDELRAIRADLDYIKTHMIDVDSLASEEDEKALQKAMLEHRKGKTILLEELEKELG